MRRCDEQMASKYQVPVWLWQDGYSGWVCQWDIPDVSDVSSEVGLSLC